MPATWTEVCEVTKLVESEVIDPITVLVNSLRGRRQKGRFASAKGRGERGEFNFETIHNVVDFTLLALARKSPLPLLFLCWPHTPLPKRYRKLF